MVQRNYEIWKVIKGFPNYQISNFGRVKSFQQSPKGKIRKTGDCGGRYLRIDLKNEAGKRKDFLVHLLVISYFGPPKPSPLHECNHKDGDRYNNWIINLEWMTHSENMKHGYDNGLFADKDWKGIKVNTNKLTEKDVIKIGRLYNKGKYNQTELAKKYGVSQANIGYIVNNKSWRYLL